jgi:hypothetical protein
MVKVVIVNGRPESGKTTFEWKCRELLGASSTFWFNENKRTLIDVYSTIDFVKEIAKQCGWDGIKSPENRKFLSDLKDLLTQWNDIPYKKVIETAKHLREDRFCCPNDWILFVDCREPEEIQKLKERLNATTVLVRRLDDEVNETSNHADANVFNYEYDYTIKNYGDLSDLVVECVNFLDYMKERESYELCN